MAVAKRGRPARSSWSATFVSTFRVASSAGTDSPWVSSCSMATAPPERSSRAARFTTCLITVRPSEPANTALNGSCSPTSGGTCGADRHVRRVAQHQVDLVVQVGQQAGVGHVARVQPDRARPTLRRAHASAVGSISTACTTASGRAAATATASAPEPVHRSTTTGFGRPRGTPGPTRAAARSPAAARTRRARPRRSRRPSRPSRAGAAAASAWRAGARAGRWRRSPDGPPAGPAAACRARRRARAPRSARRPRAARRRRRRPGCVPPP